MKEENLYGCERARTHHDDASGLLHRAHAHDGRHADGGALEVNPAARKMFRKSGKGRQQELITTVSRNPMNRFKASETIIRVSSSCCF